MAANNRPGVYASYEVTSALTGSGNGGAVGIAAVSAIDAPVAASQVLSYADAVASYGADSNLAQLVRLAFLNGAPAVYAAPIPAAASDPAAYTAAFNALNAFDNIKIVVCDSRESEIRSAFLNNILTAPDISKFRIGIMEAGSSVNTGIAYAEDFNSERMIVAFPSASELPLGSAAAALAGIITSSNDPATPLNGAVLRGISSLSKSLSDTEIETLIDYGVSPLERSGSAISVIRGVTTRTQTADVPDATWREITTTLIADDVVSTLRNALKSRFSRTKNTEQTRGAIRTQVIIELENKKSREIIDDYGNVTVNPLPDDPTVCEVFFEFTVAHGLNQIFITANITV